MEAKAESADTFQAFDAASRDVAEIIQDLIVTADAEPHRPIGRHEATKAWKLYLRIRQSFAYGMLSAIDDWEPLLASFGNPSDVVEFHQSSDDRIRGTIILPTAHGMAVALLSAVAYSHEISVEPDGEQTEEEEAEVASWLRNVWFVREPTQLHRLHSRILRERACAAAHLRIELIGARGFRGSQAPDAPIPFTRKDVATYTGHEVSSLTSKAKEWGPVLVKAAKGRPEVRDYRAARESLKTQYPHLDWPTTPPW